LMLILACAKQTLDIDRMTRNADWKRPPKGNMELNGKTLGIVGVGNIGRRMARLGKALGMRVIGYDKYVPADELRRRGVEPVGSLEALLPQVDVLTCHTPLTDETRHMIDDKALPRMKKGAIFIRDYSARGMWRFIQPVHNQLAGCPQNQNWKRCRESPRPSGRMKRRSTRSIPGTVGIDRSRPLATRRWISRSASTSAACTPIVWVARARPSSTRDSARS